MNRSTPGLPVHHQLLEFTPTHNYWVGDTIQPSHLLSSPSSPAPNPSQHQGLFQWVNSLHEWPKYWSFSLSISPSNEHPGLISFRMDWLDLLAVQGTLKSLFQHHSWKASSLRRSAFFTVQLSHPYMTTGKTIALTRRTFVGKVMSLHFNMLSRLVITFPPRSKRLLISWLQSPSAVILDHHFSGFGNFFWCVFFGSFFRTGLLVVNFPRVCLPVSTCSSRPWAVAVLHAGVWVSSRHLFSPPCLHCSTVSGLLRCWSSPCLWCSAVSLRCV